ncbi:MAG: DUF1257 domain-containing protein [Candidatus Sericytochromatia bacterium]|nr:DUF1257 domain-containing protein [Candidatus Sericytochromatia bacterium]
MSHFSRVQTKMTDAGCLHRALVALNYQVRENALVRGYVGRVESADFVVDPGGHYDIGFTRHKDGTFFVVADWWGVQKDTGLREQDVLPKVNQRYAYEVISNALAAQGFQLVHEHQGQDRSIQMTLRRWS